MALLESPMFLIFGGGAIIAIVAIVADYMRKAQELRMKERERAREHDQEVERRLLGLDGDDAIQGVSLRLQALEKDMAEIRALLKQPSGPSQARPVNSSAKQSDDAQPESDLFALQ